MTEAYQSFQPTSIKRKRKISVNKMEEDYKFAKIHILLHRSLASMKDSISKDLREYSGKVKLSVFLKFILEEACGSDLKTGTVQIDLDMRSCKYDLDQSLRDITEKLFRDIELFKGCESEWVISKLQRLDIITAKT